MDTARQRDSNELCEGQAHRGSTLCSFTTEPPPGIHGNPHGPDEHENSPTSLCTSCTVNTEDTRHGGASSEQMNGCLAFTLGAIDPLPVLSSLFDTGAPATDWATDRARERKQEHDE